MYNGPEKSFLSLEKRNISAIMEEETENGGVVNVLWEALVGPVVFKEKLHQS